LLINTAGVPGTGTGKNPATVTGKAAVRTNRDAARTGRYATTPGRGATTPGRGATIEIAVVPVMAR
jgi:hypothetical protein